MSTPGPVAPKFSGRTGYLEGGFGPMLPLDQWPNAARIKQVQPDLSKLVAAIDFIGVSNYAR